MNSPSRPGNYGGSCCGFFFFFLNKSLAHTVAQPLVAFRCRRNCDGELEQAKSFMCLVFGFLGQLSCKIGDVLVGGENLSSVFVLAKVVHSSLCFLFFFSFF